MFDSMKKSREKQQLFLIYDKYLHYINCKFLTELTQLYFAY